MRKLIQPIVVLKTGEHFDTIRAAAGASVEIAFRNTLQPNEVVNLEEWLNGIFTKVVRRGSINDFKKIIEWTKEENVSFSIIENDTAMAMSFAPMWSDELPKVISKLQVNNTDFERNPRPNSFSSEFDDPRMFLLSDLSTGKAASQVAHALWMLMLDGYDCSELRRSGYRNIEVYDTDASEMPLKEMGSNKSIIKVVDAGLTEIKPNTVTVMVEY